MHSQGLSSQAQLPMQGMNSLGQGQMPVAGGQQSMNASPQQQGQGDQSGAPDYSAQWAQYYRSIGKVKEAEAIEAQMKSKVSSGGAGIHLATIS
jgi:far upstream element-binding protein